MERRSPMKRFVLLGNLLLIVFALAAWQYTIPGHTGATAASGSSISGCSGAPSDTGSSGCLLREIFEGSTTCYSGYGTNCNNAWNFISGTWVSNYATSPAPLQGSNSLRIVAGGLGVGYLGYTSSATVYVGALVNLDAYTANTNSNILAIESVQGTPVCTLSFNTFTPTQFQVSQTGGTTQGTNVTFVANTTYYVKLEGSVGTGANAVCAAQFSNNGSSWGFTATSSNGTWTANLVDLVEQQSGNAGIDKIVDDIRVSTSTFNYW